MSCSTFPLSGSGTLTEDDDDDDDEISYGCGWSNIIVEEGQETIHRILKGQPFLSGSPRFVARNHSQHNFRQTVDDLQGILQLVGPNSEYCILLSQLIRRKFSYYRQDVLVEEMIIRSHDMLGADLEHLWIVASGTPV